MDTSRPPRANLIAALPADRYRIMKPAGRAPRVGDVLELDQGYTGEDGSPMVLAYCPGPQGRYVYEAHVFESELGPPLDNDPDGV